MRYKVNELGLEADIFRLLEEGMSSKKIIKELIDTGKIPLDIGLSKQTIDYWRKKWRQKKGTRGAETFAESGRSDD